MGNVNIDGRDFGPTQNLMANSLVWDNHGCMPLRSDDFDFLPQLERYKKSGVDIVSLNVGYDVVPWENTVLVAAHFRKWIRDHSDDYLLIESVDDVETARASDRLGICFDIEGASALNENLSMVEAYYELGVRWMLMAYNLNNAVGGGCQDDDKGLTKFGHSVLDEMARLGMVVCCSHTGFKTTMEVMERASNPVIFSHSNPFALMEHTRNIKDEAIKACAETGGVVGINGIGVFLGANDDRTETIVRHVDYVAQLVGPEHVGLGLDYVFDQQELDDFLKNHPETFPPELGYNAGLKMVKPEQTPEIVQSLLKLGYSDADLRLILGENHLRVAQQVWK
jgi:membrane dipeptidase